MKFLLVFKLSIIAALFSYCLHSEIQAESDRKEIVSPKLSIENIYERSEFWPFKVSLKESASLNISKVFPHTLLSIDSDGYALIDAGREGRFKVDVLETDILKQAERIAQNQLVKEMPNFLNYFNNVFVKYNGPFTTLPLLNKEKLVENQLLTLIYLNESVFEESVSEEIFNLISSIQSIEHNEVLCIPTSISFYQDLVQSNVRELNLANSGSFYAYIDAYGHRPIRDGMTLVLIDLNGKKMEHVLSSDHKEYTQMLEQIKQSVLKNLKTN